MRTTIVVADDYGPMLEKMSSWLAERFDVIARVSSGSAAFDAVEALRPDILVIDVGINGVETARRLQERHSATKIVLVSAAAFDRSIGWESLGVRACVPKVRMRSDLMIAIREILAGRTYFAAAEASRR